MTDRTPAAFALSLTLHALIVAILLLFTYSVNLRSKEGPKIFELVAGDGNDYLATKAPTIGSPDAVKLTVPAPSTPKAEAPKPEPAKPEAVPVIPIPAPPPPKATPTPKAPRTMAQELRRQLANADLRAKKEVAKQRDEEQKRLAKEESDRLAKAKNDKSNPPKIARIDGPGLKNGLAGGSPDVKAGAGGHALTAEEGTAMERYFSALRTRLQEALDKPAGAGDTLVTTVEFRLDADGSISGVRITKSSGSREFDDAVRAAFRRLGSMGRRPDGKSEVVELDFRAKEENDD